MWHIPDSMLASDAERSLNVAAEDRGGESVFRVVGDANCLLLSADPENRLHRTK